MVARHLYLLDSIVRYIFDRETRRLSLADPRVLKSTCRVNTLLTFRQRILQKSKHLFVVGYYLTSILAM